MSGRDEWPDWGAMMVRKIVLTNIAQQKLFERAGWSPVCLKFVDGKRRCRRGFAPVLRWVWP